MDKNSIDRKKLKYNFLKKIIIRFDYDGMDDTELDQVISSISMEFIMSLKIRNGVTLHDVSIYDPGRRNGDCSFTNR